MITFNNTEKRWLEIIFYLLCQKIFKNNNNIEDVLDFIKGFKWTNLFNYTLLTDAIIKQKILLNKIAPQKHEFIITINNPNCRLRIKTNAVQELVKDSEYTYRRTDTFHAQMREEINPTEIFPKLTIPKIHETIYSFLLATRYIADIIKQIKF